MTTVVAEPCIDAAIPAGDGSGDLRLRRRPCCWFFQSVGEIRAVIDRCCGAIEESSDTKK